MGNPNQPIGFSIPSAPNQPGGYYPPHPQQPGYPPQQQQYPQPGQGYPPPAYNNHQPFPAPIQNQPGYGGPHTGGNNMQWFAHSDFQTYLIGASSFQVKQKVELLEALVGWETGNKYSVKDHSGNKVFYVGEDSGCMGRQFCGEYRPFNLTAKDSRGNNVLMFDRNIDCSCCCGLICPDSIDVTTAAGQKLGSVTQEFSIFTPRFKIRDANGATVLKIEGPCCPCALKCGPVVFKVTNKNGVAVGTISKVWGGITREFLTDADTFSMTFPPDLDVSIKAVCLGALFLIDFRYFESESTGLSSRLRSFAR